MVGVNSPVEENVVASFNVDVCVYIYIEQTDRQTCIGKSATRFDVACLSHVLLSLSVGHSDVQTICSAVEDHGDYSHIYRYI